MLCQGFCVTNTYFKHKDTHKVSWMHPRSKKWHQLDLVLERRNRIQDVNSTRSYHSADCDTDHSLTISRVLLKPKRSHHSKPKRLSKINITHTGDAVRTQEYISLISDICPAGPDESAETRWYHLSSTIHKFAIQAYGMKTRKNTDFYDANLLLLEPATRFKRQDLINLKQNPNLSSLRKARGGSQAIAGKCANDYWLQLCSFIEYASSQGLLKAYEGEVPQDMRDTRIVTLFKNRGDRSDCNNYRGISLLSIVGKLFARVALNRLQILAHRVYPESQCGFRSCRANIDMIFSLRQLQETCREQRQPLYLAFVDLTKAIDLASRKGLFKLLQRIGCPPTLLSIIMSFQNDMRGTVSFDGDTSKPFKITSGVK
ncbi:RNA-directed DNA polymerase from mobile element jockey [Holothuria leucospilota]|uniref:RNA-directed DNA polymerase from mobile element jockey n=1 Tax=Holothuria leucospilota TaxID=206669 RepID=A0A9Q1HFM6_HOLLE|nr:RNA-directed DNA polymerase from mobile element jockey [Holothuria leucospilota]